MVDSGISTVDVLGSTVVEVVVSGTVVSGTVVVAGSVTGTVSGGTVEEEVVVGGVDSVVNAHSGKCSNLDYPHSVARTAWHTYPHRSRTSTPQ